MNLRLAAKALVVIAVALLESESCCGAPTAENLALRRPYVVEPQPSYPLTADSNDAIQLTDGLLTDAAQAMWKQKLAVGWTSTPLVRVTIDLGQPRDVGDVAVHTAAGIADVAWPTSMFAFVGDSPEKGECIGELLPSSPVGKGYGAAWYVSATSKATSARGRYVIVAFAVPNRLYGFVDEIQVHPPSQARNPRQTAAPVGDVTDYVRATETSRRTRDRIATDASRVKALLPGASQDVQRALGRELDDLIVATTHSTENSNGRSTIPLNALHRNVFRAQASLWRATGSASIVGWVANPWVHYPHITRLPTASSSSIELDLLRGDDRRAALVVVANTTNVDQTALIHIDRLDSSNVALSEVQWTDTAEGTVIASALTPAERTADGFRVQLIAGLPRQLWLTFRAGSAPPGALNTSIRITSGSTTVAIPVHLRISRFELPGEELHVAGFDYSNADSVYELRSTNVDSIVKLLRDHSVDTTWATTSAMPFGQLKDNHFDALSINTHEFDRWVTTRWPRANRYMIFLNIGHQGLTAQSAIREWTHYWASHARSVGVDPAQLWFLLVDEPRSNEDLTLIRYWSEAIRSAGEKVHIVEDLDQPNDAAIRLLSRACDLLVVNRRVLAARPALARQLQVACAAPNRCDLGIYNTLVSAHLLDPYSYYRLQSWSAWSIGATASMFWSFIDAGSPDLWNSYWGTRGGNYVPYFLNATTATASKQLEAIREGVEDYAYLSLLRSRRNAAATTGAVTFLKQADAILDAGVARVLEHDSAADYSWQKSNDRLEADNVRQQILSLLNSSPN